MRSIRSTTPGLSTQHNPAANATPMMTTKIGSTSFEPRPQGSHPCSDAEK